MAASSAAAPASHRADFRIATASAGARLVADWVVASEDNHGMPFVIVDKPSAQAFVFSPAGRLEAAAPVLLGLAFGDESAPGIGARKLADIRPEERTTPAGRFVASLGADLGEQDVLWVDYDAAISLHRVVAGQPKERRAQRLATPTPNDNRISYGCINVPAAFYDSAIRPAFLGGSGVVYVLPDVRSIRQVFGI
jgi:hypothetical protein